MWQWIVVRLPGQPEAPEHLNHAWAVVIHPRIPWEETAAAYSTTGVPLHVVEMAWNMAKGML